MTSIASRSVLAATIEAARVAHPGASVPDEVFTAFLARRLDDMELTPELALRHAGDLLLACGALDGEPAALQEIERSSIASLDPAIGGLVPPHDVAEVKQRLRHLLFVPSSRGAPKIGSYAGRGPLRAWVRAAAIRIALDLRREGGADRGDDATLLFGNMPGGSDERDPVLTLFRDRYAPEFRAAFEAALAALEPSDRTLLRQHYVDGVGVEDLALLHGVHRVTTFRRLGKLRRQLLARTRRELGARVQADPRELDSIMRAVQSRLDVTLERVLASRP